jgi:hypothetical protein
MQDATMKACSVDFQLLDRGLIYEQQILINIVPKVLRIIYLFSMPVDCCFVLFWKLFACFYSRSFSLNQILQIVIIQFKPEYL